jgi:lysozyme family protein
MYSKIFENAINRLMLYEVGGSWNLEAPGVRDGTNLSKCGYSNDPIDPGGETKYGIAKNSHQSIDIAGLTWDMAESIYYKEYWLAGSCDKLPNHVALLQFDGCVNHGVGTASKFIQRAAGTEDDGHIGQQTLASIAGLDAVSMCNQICDQRAQFYKDIVTRKPTQSKYIAGWLRRIEEMRTFSLNSIKTT